jgi:hypothetical protein
MGATTDKRLFANNLSGTFKDLTWLIQTNVTLHRDFINMLSQRLFASTPQR